MKVIDQFTGHWEPLSNFAACSIFYKDRMYNSAEAAYQSAKIAPNNVAASRYYSILGKATAAEAKLIGKWVPLRKDWEEIKLSVMKDVLLIKFTTVPSYRHLLLSTDSCKLVEGNHWHDNYWGSCTCLKCGNKGENHLGQLLMDVRAILSPGPRTGNKEEPFDESGTD